MKFFLFSLLIIFHLKTTAQTNLPDNFKIGGYVEVFGTDSIKIYFNCTGTVTNKLCASYYRVGKMDSTIINVVGNFHDYTLNGKLAFKATMLQNKLEGPAQYYYTNGRVQEEGTYRNNIRHGRWTFYYSNGNIEKVFHYINGYPIVLEAYERNGKATVVNGNGYFETNFSSYKNCFRYTASGPVQNGKKHGKWDFAVATEIYEEGKFVKGNSYGREYTEKPSIRFTNFYANEHLGLINNNPGCPGDSFRFWRYKEQDIYRSFYPELKEQFDNYKQPVKNQWLVVGIKISKKDKVSGINVASSINDHRIENYVYGLLSKMTDWKTLVVHTSRVESDLFFTLIVHDNRIIIPAYLEYRNGAY